MAMTEDPINCRRIAIHYNFHKTQNVFFDEWIYADDKHNLRIANKYTGLNLLIDFDPTQQNSGAS